jgi:hypothetical protein
MQYSVWILKEIGTSSSAKLLDKITGAYFGGFDGRKWEIIL